MSNPLPWSKFYWSDWRSDPNLRRCSKAAKGFWIDCLALMYECEDRGVLSTGGKPWSDDDIAAAVGGDMAENLSCLHELLDKGVACRNNAGAVYSRRMVRDEEIRHSRAEAGRKGGSKTQAKGQAKSKQTLSDSDSDSESPPVGYGGTGERGDDVHPAERYHHREAVDRLWNLLPKRVRRKRPAFQTAAVVALRTVDEATLANRLAAYYQSPEGSGTHFREAHTWLSDAGWSEADEAWSGRDENVIKQRQREANRARIDRAAGVTDAA